MVVGTGPLFAPGHTTFGVAQQRNLEAASRRDFLSRSLNLPDAERGHLDGLEYYYQASPGATMNHALPGGNSFTHSGPAAQARESKLMRLAERRRTDADAKLGFQNFGSRPLVALPRAKPDAPPKDDTEAWRRTAHQLERPAVVRLLAALHGRLEHEQASTSRSEARLRRRAGGKERDWGSFSMTELPFHERCGAEAFAREQGLWPKGAAGHRQPVRTLTETRGRKDRGPRPRSAEGGPLI